jgi:hypothetical protein
MSDRPALETVVLRVPARDTDAAPTITRAEETLHGVVIMAEQAARLARPPGTPGLLTVRRSFAGEQLVEVRHIIQPFG